MLLWSLFFVASVIIYSVADAQQIAFSTGDLVFKGDLRYRHEQISQEHTKQRDRERIRARMSVSAMIDPKMNFIFGVASGSNNDPISSNQDMGGGFSDKSLWIDMAYFDWTSPVIGLKIQGGKMKNPFLAVGRNQMIWDHDLNPEGLAARFSKKFGSAELFANASWFWITERAAGEENYLIGGQTGIKKSVGSVDAIAGAGFFGYTNIKGYSTFYDTAKSYGNSVNAQMNYLHDYRVAETFCEMTLNTKIPVGIQFDYALNTASDVKDDTAYLVGLAFGKIVLPGSMSGRVMYRSVERDAVVGAFNDSDFGGGGTDNKGMVIQYDYQYLKNATIGTTYFISTIGMKNGIEYNRLQVDVNMKF